MVELGWARTTVNKQLSRVRRVFKWAVGQQLIPATVLVALQSVAALKKGRTAARETEPVGPVDDADVERTLPHLSRPVRAMVQLQRLTGMRPAEATQLRPGDLDRSAVVWVYTPRTHKTDHLGRVRRIPLGPRAQELLVPFLARPPEVFCFSPKEAVEEVRERQRRAREWSGRASQAKPPKARPERAPRAKYSTDSYRVAIHRTCVRHSIPVWSPNRLRHSAATEIRAKFGIEAGTFRIVIPSA